MSVCGRPGLVQQSLSVCHPDFKAPTRDGWPQLFYTLRSVRRIQAGVQHSEHDRYVDAAHGLLAVWMILTMPVSCGLLPA